MYGQTRLHYPARLRARVNIGCPVDHINVYDSMPYCSTSKRTKEEICSILFSSAEEITLDYPCVRKQKGGSDCGLRQL